MDFRSAIISGYTHDPEFMRSMLLALEHQTTDNFDVYVFASPTTAYYLEDEFIDNLNFKCYHLKLEKNGGFTANNNYLIKKAFSIHPYKYIVLVNDDTKPQPNWLKGMTDAAEENQKVGAVASKMVFYEKFVTIQGKVESDYIIDERNLGIRLYNNSKFKGTFYPKKFYQDGFFQDEEDEFFSYRWTKSDFRFEMPVNPHDGDVYTLQLYIKTNHNLPCQVLSLFIEKMPIGQVELKNDQLLYEVEIPAHIIQSSWHYIIQNAGSGLTKEYSGYDIGFGEIDKDQYSSKRFVEMFCGGSCLLSREALVKSGLFREGLFAYYEDSDLSLRIRKQGYQIIYAPQSVINHYHTGTNKEWSPFFTYHAFRNKIIFATNNFGSKGFIFSAKERWKETWMFLKLFIKSKFKDNYYKRRLKLNIVILKDAFLGIIRFKPTHL